MRSWQALAVPAEVSKARLGHEDSCVNFFDPLPAMWWNSLQGLCAVNLFVQVCTDRRNYSSRPCSVGVGTTPKSECTRSCCPYGGQHSLFNGQSAWHAALRLVDDVGNVKNFTLFVQSLRASLSSVDTRSVMFWLWTPFYDHDARRRALLSQNKLSSDKLCLCCSF